MISLTPNAGCASVAGWKPFSTPMCSCRDPTRNQHPPRDRSGSGFSISSSPSSPPKKNLALPVRIPPARQSARGRSQLTAPRLSPRFPRQMLAATQPRIRPSSSFSSQATLGSVGASRHSRPARFASPSQIQASPRARKTPTPETLVPRESASSCPPLAWEEGVPPP